MFHRFPTIAAAGMLAASVVSAQQPPQQPNQQPNRQQCMAALHNAMMGGMGGMAGMMGTPGMMPGMGLPGMQPGMMPGSAGQGMHAGMMGNAGQGMHAGMMGNAGQGMHAGMQGGMGPMAMGASPRMLLAARDELGLTADQVSRLEAIQKRVDEAQQQHMQAGADAQRKAAAAVSGETKDLDALQAALQDAATQQIQAHIAMLRAAVDAHAVLNKEQTQKLASAHELLSAMLCGQR